MQTVPRFECLMSNMRNGASRWKCNIYEIKKHRIQLPVKSSSLKIKTANYKSSFLGDKCHIYQHQWKLQRGAYTLTRMTLNANWMRSERRVWKVKRRGSAGRCETCGLESLSRLSAVTCDVIESCEVVVQWQSDSGALVTAALTPRCRSIQLLL